VNAGRNGFESGHDQADDPGWRPSLAGLLLFMPGLSIVLAQRRSGRADGLILLRTVFLSFVSALFFVGVVVVVLLGITSGSLTDGGAVPAAALVAAVGMAGLFVSHLIGQRPLDCGGVQALAESYRKSFFLRIALAELAALVAFVASFLVGAGWLYLLGAVFSAAGFAGLAPTAGRLAQRQEDLERAGCPLRLADAVRRLPFRSP
jgi:hypothetical protein